jgi:hypothetical protein
MENCFLGIPVIRCEFVRFIILGLYRGKNVPIKSDITATVKRDNTDKGAHVATDELWAKCIPSNNHSLY